MQTISGYQPSNAGYSLTNGASAKTGMEGKQASAVQTQAAADAARDDAVATEWTFHDYVLGVKDQIRAQFGKDSNEVQAMGLKKKSEYLSGRRTPKPNGGATP